MIDFLKYPFSRTIRTKMSMARKGVCNRLIMTLLVRDEEDIIEKNIRFHAAMGVDGFIVTSHNSHDGTDVILERLKDEGLVLELLKVESPRYEQSVWVKNMIRIAKNKHGADWVINADADEFFYSEDLDLKTTINKYSNMANVLWVDSIFFFPDGTDDYLHQTRFVLRPLKMFESKQLSLDPIEYAEYIGSQGCVKVIHSTRNFVSIAMGNHKVTLKKNIEVHCADIRLYHYHIRSMKEYEKKVLRYIDVMRLMPPGMGEHMRHMIDLYKRGLLNLDFEKRFLQKADILMENGVVGIDPSVRNFMKKEGII